MRLLDKYLLRELLVPLAYCLVGFTIFWIAFSSFKDLEALQEAKLRLGDIVLYYVITLPAMVVTVLPIALLLALLYALSNHARHHEITAIRAAGVSLWRLSRPYFAVGFACSVALFALNEFAVPDSALKAEQLRKHRSKTARAAGNPAVILNLGFVNTAARREWLIGSYDLNTAEMINPRVIWTLADGSQRWLYATRASRTNDGWIFYDAREYRDDPGKSANLVPSLMTNVLARHWEETPAQIRTEVKIASRITSPTSREADLPLVEIREYLKLHPVLDKQERRWLETKWHGRLAMPWTCLVVVLIALPFGAPSGRRNVFVGVASSVFIAFSFFVLTQLSLALGTGGYLPAWLAAWLPNLVFGGAGIWFTARVR
ncbi:MAG: YjgP/YjgQ family permease [Pedosphaera sp.]|nr:YjgP/YjgQ family permease [Pedosphaera sp.]